MHTISSHKNNAFALIAIIAIIALFSLAITQNVYAGTPTVVSGKITGPNTITMTYSEPVNTENQDYFNWSGALSGRSVNAISGNGGSTVTLTMSGSPLYGDATGNVTLNSTLRSTSTNSPLATTTVQITDSQPPALTYINVSSNTAGNAFAKSGGIINLSFSTNEPIHSVSATIMGQTVYPSGNGSGPYTASYTVTSSNTADMVPITLRYSDVAGNSGALSLSMTVTTAMTGSGTAVPATIATSASGTTNTTSNSTITDPVATEAPSTYEVNRIISPATTATPSYTFFSNSAGTITYGGPCSSNTTVAIRGNNTITFNPLANNLYSNCTITVRNSFGPGNILPVTTFSVNVLGGTSGTATPLPTTAIIDSNYAVNVPGCRVGFDTVSPVTGQPCNQPAATLGGTTGTGAQVSPSPSYTPATTPSTTSSQYFFTVALSVGSRGSEVLALQNRLYDDGYLLATPNGNFGPATEAAVKAFQRAHGISPLGNVGPATRAALNK